VIPREEAVYGKSIEYTERKLISDSKLEVALIRHPLLYRYEISYYRAKWGEVRLTNATTS
jgi:hypothetical protein